MNISEVIALYERNIIGLIETRNLIGYYYEGFKTVRDSEMDTKLKEQALAIAQRRLAEEGFILPEEEGSG